MDDAADEGADDDGEERQQHLRPVLCDDRQEERENAVRRERHDRADRLVADLGAGIEKADELHAALAADLRDGDADEEREDDDGQDVALCHRRDGIRRNHVDKNLHDGRRFLHLGRRAAQSKANARMNDARHRKADDDGDRRRRQVDADRLGADAPERLRVAEARDADDQRREYDGHDHHLDEVDEDRADRRDPPVDEADVLFSHGKSDDDREDECDEDAYREIQGFHTLS